MKKIMNRPETLVAEMCNGLILTYPHLEVLQRVRVIKKKELNPHKVTLISGGGSGHEPAHAGFIGAGMLDAAVCGDVFASPSQIQVYHAIKQTVSNKGTLLIIKNYSGDVMNFTNAAEMAREENINVDFVKVDDDIAVKDSLYTVGRRGVAGTVLVHKIAGAAAEEGLSLAEVKALAEKAVSAVGSIGFAYTSCVVPAAGVPTFEIGAEEMEYGVGIHGEPGVSREQQITADALSVRMVDDLQEDLNIRRGDEVALLVNGFGGTPLMELFVLAQSVAGELDNRGLKPVRCFTGNYMTSIDMLGASVSLMKLDDTLKKYLDAESQAPGFVVTGKTPDSKYLPVQTSEGKPVPDKIKIEDLWYVIRGDKITLENIMAMVDCMGECILENEVAFCKLDSFAGDGDFGMSVAKGFTQLKREWEDIRRINAASIKDFLLACSMVIMEYCGGASGPIWGSAFRAAALNAGEVTELDIRGFASMMQAAVKGVQTTGARSFGRGAQVGDKTLIDALVPCAEAVSHYVGEGARIEKALQMGAKAAVAGAERTKDIVARLGRASVVGERSLGHPDAGAYALGVIFTAVAHKMRCE